MVNWTMEWEPTPQPPTAEDELYEWLARLVEGSLMEDEDEQSTAS